MEISQVRRHVRETIERAKRAAAERRVRTDEAMGEFEAFLTEIAIPLFRQIAGALRAESHMFSIFTPAGSVRLMSDRSGDDYVELLLDTSGDPQVIGHTRRTRGRRVIESEAPLRLGRPLRELTEEDVVTFVMKELEPFLER
jgi:hypothetical protein